MVSIAQSAGEPDHPTKRSPKVKHEVLSIHANDNQVIVAGAKSWSTSEDKGGDWKSFRATSTSPFDSISTDSIQVYTTGATFIVGTATAADGRLGFYAESPNKPRWQEIKDQTNTVQGPVAAIAGHGNSIYVGVQGKPEPLTKLKQNIGSGDRVRAEPGVVPIPNAPGGVVKVMAANASHIFVAVDSDRLLDIDLNCNFGLAILNQKDSITWKTETDGLPGSIHLLAAAGSVVFLAGEND